MFLKTQTQSVQPEIIPIKSLQYDCLNMSQTRTTTDMLKWIGKVLNTTQRTIGNWRLLSGGEIDYPIPHGQP